MQIALFVFVVVLTIVFGTYWALVLRLEDREQSALRQRLKPASVRLAQAAVLLRAPDKLSGIQFLNRLLSRYGAFVAPIKQSLSDAGLPVTVSTLLLMCAFSALAVTLAVNLYTGVWWLALASGAGTGFAPLWVVKFLRTRRIRKFEELFPEAVELISRALRAGHSFPTGVQMAADEMPAPAGPEFRLLYDRQNYGAQLSDALKTFAERIPSLDARFFVTAVMTQREAGGNLSEVLDRLASVMRERFRIKREVRVKSAHGRMTALVLAGMPPVLAVLMYTNNPEQMAVMMVDPLGIRMLILGAVLEVIGIFVIRKLVDIEY